MFYFTDNLVTYYIVRSGSSSSSELHKLIQEIKRLELLLECRVEVVHVPGTMMIDQGTGGLSRGLPMAVSRHPTSSVTLAAQILAAVPFTPGMRRWALEVIGLSRWQPYSQFDSISIWDFQRILQHLSIWTPTPETARQALRAFLDIWVEAATTTSAIFIVPSRVMQRDWGFLSKNVQEIAVVYPRDLPPYVPLSTNVPLVVLYIPPYVRYVPLVVLYIPPYVRSLPMSKKVGATCQSCLSVTLTYGAG
jgi:hypothetical protein